MTQLRLDNIRVYQQDTKAQLIGWNLWAVGNEDASTATVTVERAYAENGDYTILAQVPATAQLYLDLTVNLSDIHRMPFYRLTVSNNGVDKVYDPVRLDGDFTGPANGLIRASQILLRQAGEPVLIYARRFDDTRCSCWDAVLQKVTDANCTICFGTGYVGGYYAPVLTLAHVVTEQKQKDPSDILRQDSVTRALIANYPLLRPRDLIYYIDYGAWFRVGGIEPAEFKRVTVNQTFTATRINPADVETTIVVPDLSTLTPVLTRAFSGKVTFANAASSQSPSNSIQQLKL